MRSKENVLHGTAVPGATLQGYEGHVPADHEPSPVPWCHDPAEHLSANWEAAWIDLGGEG